MKGASTAHYHLVGATVHSLTSKQMPLLVELRRFEGRHTAASIQDYLTQCCDNLADVGCQVVAISSDNAANIQSDHGCFCPVLPNQYTKSQPLLFIAQFNFCLHFV